MSDDDSTAKEPEVAGNPIAWASLALGIVALLVCWLPFVGLLAVPSGSLALALAVAGIVVAAAGKRRGVVVSAIGGAMGLLAVFGAFAVSWSIASSMADSMAAAADAEAARRDAMARAANAQPALPQFPPQFPPLDFGRPDPGAPERRPVPPLVVRPPGVAMGEPSAIGDIEVRVVKAERGKVRLRLRDARVKASQPPDTRQEFLAISIEVRTTNPGRKVDYRTLASSKVSLHDDLGNRYRFVEFGPLAVPRGRTEAGSLASGRPVGDILVFELPVEAASSLTLELPAEAAGLGRVAFRFEIPVGAIAAR